MKYYICMRTFNSLYNPKPRKNKIKRTLESLEKSGLFKSNIPFEFHLFDGGSPDINYLLSSVKEHMTLHRFINRLTRNENWLQSIEYSTYIDCDYIISLEDDLLFCKNWLESIDKYIKNNSNVINTNPMTTFYSAYKEIEERYKLKERKLTYWDMNYNLFYGTQCVLFKKDIGLFAAKHIKEGIKNFNTYKFNFRNRKNCGGMKVMCIDLWLQEWAKNCYKNQKFIASVPCFVQHIGAKAGEPRYHHGFFLGEEWSYE